MKRVEFCWKNMKTCEINLNISWKQKIKLEMTMMINAYEAELILVMIKNTLALHKVFILIEFTFDYENKY